MGYKTPTHIAKRVAARGLEDTGFFARHFLGFDYDKDPETNEIINKGEGGVRNNGPHLEMTQFLDNKESRFKHLEMPRGAYKTTIGKAYLIRRVLENRNLKVLYGSATYSKALEHLGAIKSIFETNQKIRELFGDMKGPKWASGSFTIKGSTYAAASHEATFSAWGVDKSQTGGHYDLIYMDDLVDETNSNTPEQLQKIIDRFKALTPLLEPGGTIIYVGTRWKDEDLCNALLTEMGGLYDCLVISCGMTLEMGEEGELPKLIGKPKFEHLDSRVLLEKFKQCNYDVGFFSAQYMNECMAGAQQLFHRHQFNYRLYEDWMNGLSWYVLTDTAVSEREESCYSAIAVVGLDGHDHAYLGDLDVGHWNPTVFAMHFADVVERWQEQVRFLGATFEQIGLNAAVLAVVKPVLNERGIQIRIIDVPRGRAVDGKRNRIKGLMTRFAQDRFTVLSTVPRYFNDVGKRKLLFDPEGIEVDGVPMPAGELVDEFVRLGAHGKDDIADALADIDYQPKGNRYVRPGSVSANRRVNRMKARRGQSIVVPHRMMVDGREEIVDLAQNIGAPKRRGRTSSSWSKNKIAQMRGR